LLVELGEEGIPHFERALIRHADELSQRLKVTLQLDPDVVREVFAAATASIRTHNIPLKQISCRKEAAHLGFWTAELKPISVKPPLSPREIIDRAGHMLARRIHGPRAVSERASELYDIARRTYVDQSIFPVSEYVAMSLIRTLLESLFLQQMDQCEDAAMLKIYQGRNDYFGQTLSNGVFDSIVQGLRFHIFTPRSFATLIESVFSFEGFSHVAH
jgi:hypothetical protein